MDLGLNIASAGMLAEQVQEDQLSNDLANASTPGFKASSSVQQSFGDMLLYNTKTGQYVGTVDTGVEMKKGVTDLAQGPLETTGDPLDFRDHRLRLLRGEDRQWRAVHAQRTVLENNQGVLTDQYGDDVLSQSGSPIQVGASGTVPGTALGVFALKNPSQLGNNNFSGTVTGRGTGQVESGQLEGSGIDPIQAMVQMESALDAYTAGQQTIGTIGQTMQESASSVASIP